MRPRVSVLVLVAACSGNGGSTMPKERPALRVVKCAPAVAPRSTVPAPRTTSSSWGKRAEGVSVKPVRVRLGASDISIADAKVVVGLIGIESGGLTAEQVSRVVRMRMAAFTQCYHEDLVAKTGPKNAAVAWKVIVRGDGAVASATPASSTLSANLRSCVTRTIFALKFPPSAGGVSSVTLPLVFDASGVPAPMPSADDDTPVERAAWTPFTYVTEIPTSAPVAAQATENVLRQAVPDLDRCFTANTPSGSLRAMLSIDPAGDVSSLRLGGLGDKATEDCMAKVLIKLHVVTPTTEQVEIACDVSRGDAQPWRLTPAAGYGVVAVAKSKLTYDDQTLESTVEKTDSLQDSKTYLVVAEPDATGKALTLALQWTNDGEGTVFALKDGALPPLFLGVGNTTVTQGTDTSTDDSIQPTLRVGGKQVIGCVHRALPPAKTSDGRAIGTTALEMAAKCRTLQCAPTLLVTLDPDAVAKDLVEVTGAARRAGFERVLIGGEPGCQPPRTGVPAED